MTITCEQAFDGNIWKIITLSFEEEEKGDMDLSSYGTYTHTHTLK